MKKFSAPYFDNFRSKVLSHNLKSGEIILEIWEHNSTRYNYQDFFNCLISNGEISAEEGNFKIIQINRESALSSIKYGLSSKTNYTVIDEQFSKPEQNQYANGFVEFFKNPIFLSVETRLYHQQLDLDDFWESGGAILCDDNKFGLFWINDLYDKFN